MHEWTVEIICEGCQYAIIKRLPGQRLNYILCEDGSWQTYRDKTVRPLCFRSPKEAEEVIKQQVQSR